jgi:hypothetical protein
MSHLRILRDDQEQIVAIADFMSASPSPPGHPLNKWLYTFVTHGLIAPDGKKVQNRFPALALADGKGGTSIRLAFFPERWGLVRGTTLPALEANGQNFVFPPLPDEPIPIG